MLLPISVSLLVLGSLNGPESPADAGFDVPLGPPGLADLVHRVDRLEQENRQLKKALQKQEKRLESTDEQLFGLLPLKGRLQGAIDLGFFWVEGDGSGLQSDFGNQYFPEYRGVVPDSWVFMGDPLSTMINARGDPADTGDSRAIVFDPIRSRGKPTAIVNAVTLAVFAGLAEELTLNAVVDFLPRTRIISDRQGSALGDFVDLKLAYIEYLLPITRFHASLYAGKFDSVLGYEYRGQDGADRLTVAPSLICRYTCGRPIGVKFRATLFDDQLAVNLAVTNGASFTEGFGFNTETDTNFFKTVSGRISYRFPIGYGFELGASGAVGAQDAQADDGNLQWHYGFDLHLDLADFEITAEVVKGFAPGITEGLTPASKCDAAACLSYRGAYLQAGYRFNNVVMPYFRIDARDAVHRNGASFVYISELARVTAGTRFELGEHVVLKVEYTFNFELGRIPQAPNNSFTSAAIFKF